MLRSNSYANGGYTSVTMPDSEESQGSADSAFILGDVENAKKAFIGNGFGGGNPECRPTDNLPNLPTCFDRRRTGFVVALVATAWLANDFALAWIHERVPTDVPPLPDILFSILPERTEVIKVTETLLVSNLVFAMLTILLHRYRWIVFRRVFFITALAYLGRAFCITLIQVPVPSVKTYCGPKVNQTSMALIFRRVGRVLAGLGMDSVQGRVLCGDLIYSGHTVILCITALTVGRYAPPGPKRFPNLAGWVTAGWAAGGIFCILIARKHYTIDIVLAYFVTTRLFWLYHGLVDVHLNEFDSNTGYANASYLPRYYVNGGSNSGGSRKRTTDGMARPSPLANVFWYPVFRYLEYDVRQPIPNVFGGLS